jgi:hypothetical protein
VNRPASPHLKARYPKTIMITIRCWSSNGRLPLHRVDIYLYGMAEGPKYRKTILCLAKSWRPHGHCVAGKVFDNDKTGAWLRPVNAANENAISDADADRASCRNLSACRTSHSATNRLQRTIKCQRGDQVATAQKPMAMLVTACDRNPQYIK